MIAATPSPNMEVMLFQTLNLLVKLGAHVVTASKRLHAASHATREELKMMLNMLMPKHFIPVQGEFRNLRNMQRLLRRQEFLKKISIYCKKEQL